jgi:hypothetical protein
MKPSKSNGFVAALQTLAVGFSFVACVAFMRGNVIAFIVDLAASFCCFCIANSENA